MIKRVLAIAIIFVVLLATRELAWSPPIATPDPSHPYPMPTFVSEAVSHEQADQLAIEWVKEHPDSFIAVIATKAYPVLDSVIKKLEERGDVLYYKPLYLKGNGPRNLMLSLYGELSDYPAKWIKKERSIKKHIRQRFTKPYPTYVLLYRCASLETAIEAKRSVREELSLGTTAIHVTDTHHEAQMLAELVFNKDNINLLNK